MRYFFGLEFVSTGTRFCSFQYLQRTKGLPEFLPSKGEKVFVCPPGSALVLGVSPQVEPRPPSAPRKKKR